MANLTITKTYTPTVGSTLNSTSYNTDLSALFNNFIGLEAQTTVSKGLTITPSVNGTTKFKITNAAATELFSVDTTNSYIKIKSTGVFYFGGTASTIYEGAANVLYISGGVSLSNYVYVSTGIAFGNITDTAFIDSGDFLVWVFYLGLSDTKNVIIFSTYSNFSYGLRIGANSTNNMIDDASNGSSTTPLFIGNQNIVTSTGTTGGADSAGSGNQYVEFKIGTTTYKFLHDGEV